MILELNVKSGSLGGRCPPKHPHIQAYERNNADYFCTFDLGIIGFEASILTPSREEVLDTSHGNSVMYPSPH